jgi:hypothetical protein
MDSSSMPLLIEDFSYPTQRATDPRASTCTKPFFGYTPTPPRDRSRLERTSVPSCLAVRPATVMSAALPRTCCEFFTPPTALLCLAQRTPDRTVIGPGDRAAFASLPRARG